MTGVTVKSADYYRYLRYISPNNGYGNVAEIEFYGKYKDVESGIKSVKSSDHENRDEIYDLRGRRITSCHLRKGIYIRKGNKLIIE